jgi:hypothetical protein
MTDRANARLPASEVEVLASLNGPLTGAWAASLRDSHAVQASASLARLPATGCDKTRLIGLRLVRFAAADEWNGPRRRGRGASRRASEAPGDEHGRCSAGAGRWGGDVFETRRGGLRAARGGAPARGRNWPLQETTGPHSPGARDYPGKSGWQRPATQVPGRTVRRPASLAAAACRSS